MFQNPTASPEAMVALAAISASLGVNPSLETRPAPPRHRPDRYRNTPAQGSRERKHRLRQANRSATRPR